MKAQEVHLSSSFIKNARKAVFALVFFFLAYLAILALAFVLLGTCAAIAYLLIAKWGSIVTFLASIGLVGLGVLVLLFLVKFTLAGSKRNVSDFVELQKADEPRLFETIRDLAGSLGTAAPKRIYLSAGVDAAVFYDSNFLSLFYPVGKNLQLGMGLINVLTQDELRGVIAHELGHFSQKSMKVGSYVYYVNQAIFNILYENDGYHNWAKKWGNLNGFFLFFVAIALFVIKGIQWLLQKLYAIVNRSYMALSREMEFNADEMAASVTGYEPLKSSLLRFSWAEAVFTEVQNYYLQHPTLAPQNFYEDQKAMLLDWAATKKIRLENGLPQLSLTQQDWYETTKIRIKDQWASHPPLEERIARLEATGYKVLGTSSLPANTLLRQWENHVAVFTHKLLPALAETERVSSLDFLSKYNAEYNFPALYNGYYDHKRPARPQDPALGQLEEVPELFSGDRVAWVYQDIALQNDLNTLQWISEGETFDYDGARYAAEDAPSLSVTLSAELEELQKRIQQNDANIYRYFIHRAGIHAETLSEKYATFQAFHLAYETKHQFFSAMYDALSFTQVTTPYEEIAQKFDLLKPEELTLKTELRELLADLIMKDLIPVESREKLEKYIAGNFTYFFVDKYDEQETDLLYFSLLEFNQLIAKKYYLMKKDLLEYQAGLM